MTAASTRAVVLALVAVAAVVVHLPLLSAGLVIDDVPILGQNPVLERGDVVEIMTTGWWNAVGNAEAGLHRPVTMLTFLPDRDAVGRIRPARAHAMNLVVHALAAAALAALLLRLGAGSFAAGAAGLLFAVHPIHVSAVAPLVGRADLLAGLFTLLAVLAHTWTGTSKERAASWIAGGCVFLAAGSKEIGIAAPALLLAFDLVYRRPERRRLGAWIVDRSAAYAPSALAIVAFFLLRTAAIESFPGIARVPHFANPLAAMDEPGRTATALAVVARYAALLVWPASPAVDYSGAMVRAESSLLAVRPWLGGAALAALGLAALVAVRSGATDADRRRGFAALLALAPYLVVGNLLYLIGTIMAERLVYLPSAGLGALAGIGVAALAAKGPRARRATVAGLVLAVAVLGCRSWGESVIWRSDDSIWEAELRRHPESATAQLIAGQRLHREGRLEEASARFDAVLALWPETSAAMYEKGVIHARHAEFAAAEAWLRRSVRLNPWNAAARADLGIVIRRQGRPVEAERHLRWALRDFPGMEKPASELAELLFDAGRYAEAIPYYRAALARGRVDLAGRATEAGRRAAARPIPSPDPSAP